ncbi:MAG: hypothetical protein PHP44_03795 [Kiritimatiellae bacterium]|nr:hypothetical protein [Kiritimatiellia bacterium]
MKHDSRHMMLPCRVIPVPRWMVFLVAAIALGWLGLKIMIPPRWEIQRLDSPDGKVSARLMRNRYAQESLSIMVKEGPLWRTIFYSPPLTNDYRTDPGERLYWSPEGNILFLRLEGKTRWGYDFALDHPVSPESLKKLNASTQTAQDSSAETP